MNVRQRVTELWKFEYFFAKISSKRVKVTFLLNSYAVNWFHENFLMWGYINFRQFPTVRVPLAHSEFLLWNQKNLGWFFKNNENFHSTDLPWSCRYSWPMTHIFFTFSLKILITMYKKHYKLLSTRDYGENFSAPGEII